MDLANKTTNNATVDWEATNTNTADPASDTANKNVITVGSASDNALV